MRGKTTTGASPKVAALRGTKTATIAITGTASVDAKCNRYLGGPEEDLGSSPYTSTGVVTFTTSCALYWCEVDSISGGSVDCTIFLDYGL